MIAWYPVPPLMQCITTKPLGLWGLERLNRGWAGPVCKVAREDSNQADCYSMQDVVKFCGGQTGLIVTLYEQSNAPQPASNRRHMGTQNASTGPKVYDGPTRKLITWANGGTPLMRFNGTNSHLGTEGTDLMGLSGNAALTTALLTGEITTTGQCFWLIGDQTAAGKAWYDGRENTPAPIFGVNIVSANHWFTQAVLVATTPNYLVWRKPAGGGISLATGRQNKADLVHFSQVEGTMNLTTGIVRFGVNHSATFYTPGTLAIMGHWNAVIAGAELAALEQCLERMRTMPAPVPAWKDPTHPLNFLSNVVYYMDPDTAYTQLHSQSDDRYIMSIENRGSAGGVFSSNVVPSYLLRQRLSDARFNGKPSINAPVAMNPNYLAAPSLAGVSMPGAESFCVGVHEVGNQANEVFTGFDNIGSPGPGTYVPWPDGIIYCSFASNAPYEFPTVGKVPLETPWLINVRSKPGEWAWRFNGVDKYVAPAPQYSTSFTATAPAVFGVRSGYVFRGAWAVYVLCGSVQTPAQRAQFEAWAKTTYGLAALP